MDMDSRILILSDGNPPGASDAIVVADREAAAETLGAGAISAVCLDRRGLGAALADARWLRRRRNRLPVIALVEPEQVGAAVALLANGVEELVVRGEGALESVRARAVLARQRRRRSAPADAEEDLVARGSAMRACLELIEKAKRSEATVLIQGETGTGKEVVARAIHRGGARGQQGFVAINCAAFPETLLESELFGYERGAFTGANRAKRGHFELAHGGTLFLDEIGETAFGFQVKLLRALQEGVVRPLGATREVRVDVRIIAASNRDLFQEVETGAFRRDLFYRLHVFPIHLPPLRSRVEDVVPLAERFLERRASGPRALAADAMRLLETYAWPGNVRELENEIERICASHEDEPEVTARMLSPAIQGLAAALPPDDTAETLRETMGRLERWVLVRALERHQQRRVATARSLGITRECLYKKLRRYGLQ
jgi:Nif-specific regulatory protein